MSSGFVSETELAERRRVRQEEWEKVRTAEQPLGKYNKVSSQFAWFILFVVYRCARRTV